MITGDIKTKHYIKETYTDKQKLQNNDEILYNKVRKKFPVQQDLPVNIIFIVLIRF